MSIIQPIPGIHLTLEDLSGSAATLHHRERRRPRSSDAQLAGARRSRFRGQGIEFEEVRRYQSGDDIRNIDWRVTARTGITHTKVFGDDREQVVYAVLNQSRRLFFGSRNALKSVAGARFLARLLLAQRDLGHRIGGFLYDHAQYTEYKPSQTPAALYHFFTALAARHNQQIVRIEQNGFATQQSVPGERLAEILNRLLKVAHRGAQVHLVTDLLSTDDALWFPLAALCRRCQLSYWCVVDPFDYHLPIARHLFITNGHEHLALDRLADDPTRLHPDFQQRLDDIQQHLWSIGGEMRLINTAEGSPQGASAMSAAALDSRSPQ